MLPTNSDASPSAHLRTSEELESGQVVRCVQSTATLRFTRRLSCVLFGPVGRRSEESGRLRHYLEGNHWFKLTVGAYH